MTVLYMEHEPHESVQWFVSVWSDDGIYDEVMIRK